jgi:5-carboxymethyl-2-hydroxymuconate isomerase
MLSGRSESDRKKLADTVLAALRVTVDAANGEEIQLSVETADLDRPTYAKAVING